MKGVEGLLPHHSSQPREPAQRRTAAAARWYVAQLSPGTENGVVYCVFFVTGSNKNNSGCSFVSI